MNKILVTTNRQRERGQSIRDLLCASSFQLSQAREERVTHNKTTPIALQLVHSSLPPLLQPAVGRCVCNKLDNNLVPVDRHIHRESIISNYSIGKLPISLHNAAELEQDGKHHEAWRFEILFPICGLPCHWFRGIISLFWLLQWSGNYWFKWSKLSKNILKYSQI